ncbi:hypothetical protein AUK22_11155 [bacterium CG2_30_54_10]|nr:MAG: hypothetical protein AUK22_11155 [bacterium CG2_30_54_10]
MLAILKTQGYGGFVAAKSATGTGNPEVQADVNNRHNSFVWRFFAFMRELAPYFRAGRVGGESLPGPVLRFPARTVPPFFASGNAGRGISSILRTGAPQ